MALSTYACNKKHVASPKCRQYYDILPYLPHCVILNQNCINYKLNYP